jgi:hypothetical protein
MKGLMLCSLVATTLVAILAVTLSRPTFSDASRGTAAMPSLLTLHAAAEVHKIPTEEIDDQSLVFSTQPQ